VRPPNRLTAFQFVLGFGVVSLLGDFVYEGGRSIVGPYLATLGASAAVVGVVTGGGEAVALVFRLFSGRLADRSGRQWLISIVGYVITLVSVPPLAATRTLGPASALTIAERFGKAVRVPARDTMLAQAATTVGRGRTFAIHEALDQSGALFGPLLVAGMVALSGYRLAFGVLAVPAALGILAVFRLRVLAPDPAAYEREEVEAAPETYTGPTRPFPTRFWLYSAFTALTMAGFATFALLAYHLQVKHVVRPALIPVVYAVAMGAAALAALGSGRVYDRFGLRGLVVMPPLAAVVPFLSFSRTEALVWIGALLWGTVMGVHESTMRAAVADIVPPERRGVGYGAFTAVYGLAWLGGAAIIGVLYGVAVRDASWFVLGVQAAALVAFLPLVRA
jgi:MFS family permease